MQANRRRDTRPELALRREMHRRGWRYRVDAPVLPGLRRRADMLFIKVKVAVFVDGCYWHACPVHGTQAKTNADFWREKLAANVARDRDTDRRLSGAGWTVVRVWEHEPTDVAVAIVEKALRPAGVSPLAEVSPDA
jgi:DNA mismatch endonuclease (patch repair protein)